MWRNYLAVVLSAWLAGCTTYASINRSFEATAAQKKLVGMSEEKLLACMGPPTRKASSGGTDVWQYQPNDRVQVNLSIDETRSCTVNVALTQRTVQSVSYIGPTGGFISKNEQCAFAIRACLQSVN